MSNQNSIFARLRGKIPIPHFLAALASAGLLALAMPGKIGCWPFLFCGLVPLLLAILHARPLRSALLGFCFGLAYHLALLYWIMIVLGRYGGLPWWIALPALLLLSSYMAIYSALFAFLLSLFAGRYQRQNRPLAALVWCAPILWVGLEYLRSILFTGFPWMDLAYGLFGQPRLIQAADLGGHHLVSFMLVLANALIVAIVIRQGSAINPENIHVSKTSKKLLVLACCTLIFLAGYSISRYEALQPVLERSLKSRVLVVQGNIEQSLKWSAAMQDITLDTYLRLSSEALKKTGQADTELVIWPESALPFYLQDDYRRKLRVQRFTSAANVWLLLGVPFREEQHSPDANKNDDEKEACYFNAAMLMGPDGEDSGRYYKQHLVPFGEYVPMARFLPFLAPLVVHVADFTPGNKQQKPLALGQLRLAPLICYESIFPDIARNFTKQGANLLVNISNDAWYGHSSAPYQSMAMAVFRAVENRRSLVRSANTGISGFVDPLGRSGEQSDIFVEAASSALVPILADMPLFVRGGGHFGLLCCLLIPVVWLFWRRKIS